MSEYGYSVVCDEEQRRIEKQRAAWKILMTACQECSIDPIAFANIIGISHGRALMYFKQGYGDMKFDDEQLARLARATSRSVQLWKSLFGD